ncbi:MAG: PAS domain S-box protein [Deltaproteobacteria bacterium]|nr:PAS domain S-box protein [Deltaproteobacteria bacterium]MBT6614541.1 PAS domain S-box protein [Deltaproteobacteria bacterium]MBT7714486.1 PAS domain S-box protein [Deltaproteobacteria bacterium]MBT7891635.1 PAS domain S-box protein [Deltaproteobacteria bacterium]
MKERDVSNKGVTPSKNAKLTKVDRDRYRVFIEDVADGFFETNLNGDFKFINDSLCHIFGYSRAEIKDQHYSKFMDNENARIAYENFNKIFRAGGGAAELTWNIIGKNGKVHILEVSANLITDLEDQITGFRGVARDVTEKTEALQNIIASRELAQKRFEELQLVESRFQGFLKFLPDPVYVFNLDSTVSYVNPAFEKVFGWTLEELKGKPIPFTPEDLEEQTREGLKRLNRDKTIRDFESKRITKDGRLLDIVMNGNILFDEKNNPVGRIHTLQDVTHEKRLTQSNQAIFRISEKLHQYKGLKELLDFIKTETKKLVAIEGSSIILLDEAKKEFFFFSANYGDIETDRKFEKLRFPIDQGTAGYVYKTGQPIIVPDTSKSPYFISEVDEKVGYHTKNMLVVPIQIRDHMIGVLTSVNKKEGVFDQTDMDLLSTIAGMVALPIENARIDEELKKSYEDLKSLNRAKDRVIHHLSHELKTPTSILSASLKLLAKKISLLGDQDADRILKRSERSLQRLLDMQYEIEDILQQKDPRSYYMLLTLLETCKDELEVLIANEAGEESVVVRIRKHIDDLFGPRDSPPEIIQLEEFAAEMCNTLRSEFAHRQCQINTQFEKSAPVWIPSEYLSKIIAGLIRNAVENTPDNGTVEISVKNGKEGPEFTVKDYGVGITSENQHLIFENYFTAPETTAYSSGVPYDFNAGGKGFDLLRMRIFSERYNFKIKMQSKRCEYIKPGIYDCPGNIDACKYCHSSLDCLKSGGTTMVVQFPEATWNSTKPDGPKTQDVLVKEINIDYQI